MRMDQGDDLWNLVFLKQVVQAGFRPFLGITLSPVFLAEDIDVYKRQGQKTESSPPGKRVPGCPGLAPGKRLSDTRALPDTAT